MNAGTPERVAVLLNANAQQVSERVQGAIAHVLPPEDIFMSRSSGDARSIAREVVRRSYGTVFTGGGDGTFVGFLNAIFDCLDRPALIPDGPYPSLSAVRAPRFGLLPLGTGNAVASWLGASPARRGGVLNDLLRARSGEIPSLVEIDLLEVDGRRCPFAGLGLDAEILNDYADVRRRMARTSMETFFRGGPGYALALASRTAPRMMRPQPPVEVEIINAGSPAHRLDPEGNRIGAPIDPGELLYRGPCKIVAAGTVPHLGFKVKLFPFAGRRRGMMHLRVADPPALHSVLAHLPSIWKGTWFPPGTHDFFCDRVEMRFSRPLPYQVGGDAEGTRDQVCFSMAKRSVELVSFSNHRQRYLH
jgi:hypothetical protein